MIAYCAVCTNKRNLKALSGYPWRFLLSTSTPYSINKYRDFGRKYAIDNGAYSDFVNGRPFQTERFLKLLRTFGHNAEFIVIPDSVGNKTETLIFAEHWIRKLNGRLLLVLQDDMKTEDIDPFKKYIYGLFMGGSTDWKLANIPIFSNYCIKNDLYFHVGRVNSIKRLKYCINHNVDSIDGSGPSRFYKVARDMTGYLKDQNNQLKLF